MGFNEWTNAAFYVIYLTLYLSFICSILIILLLNSAFLKIWKTHLLDVGGSYQFKLCSMRLDMRRTIFVVNASFLWFFKVCSSCFLVDAWFVMYGQSPLAHVISLFFDLICKWTFVHIIDASLCKMSNEFDVEERNNLWLCTCAGRWDDVKESDIVLNPQGGWGDSNS